MDTPSQRRIAQVAALDAEIDRLRGIATQKPIIDILAWARRDTDEAKVFLNTESIDERPYMLAMIDLALDFAARRLTLVRAALHTYGPDATLIG